MTKQEIEDRIEELESVLETDLERLERNELTALRAMLFLGDYEPIGARMPNGAIISPWDERLRTTGGIPVYE